jgi:hypothetical protein
LSYRSSSIAARHAALQPPGVNMRHIHTGRWFVG